MIYRFFQFLLPSWAVVEEKKNGEKIEPPINPKTYSAEEITCLIAQYIDDDLSCKELLLLFGNVEVSTKKFIKTRFENELLKVVKANIKKEMTRLAVANDKEFLKEMRKNVNLRSRYFLQWTLKLTKNDILLEDARLAHWVNDFQRFFYILDSIFSDTTPEAAFRNITMEWFECGEMSYECWEIWRNLIQKNFTLNDFKKIIWPTSIQNDSLKPKFLKALSKITTDDFGNKEALKAIVSLYIQKPEINYEVNEYIDEKGEKHETKTKIINVTGRIVYLKAIIGELKAMMKDIEQVDIIARNCLHIDIDLKGDLWKGINISIVADKINVWDKRTIDVSGRSYNKLKPIKKPKKALTNEPGINGRDGKPGESSGNIVIATENLINSSNLHLFLCGGNGENGQSGGDGGDGFHGINVTKDDIDKIAPNYISLTKEGLAWTGMKNYNPGFEWKKVTDECEDNKYVFYTFKNSNDKHIAIGEERELWFTYGIDKGLLPLPYNDIVLWLKGTNGTRGGMGGIKGKGGEGGNFGECTVVNPATKKNYKIDVIQKPGVNGNEGLNGESGVPGTNGNEIAFIDQSFGLSSKKHYFGHTKNVRLKLSYYAQSGEFRRINSYRKIKEKILDCYGEFECADIPVNEKLPKQESEKERSNEAKTTMKKTLLLNKALEKAQKHKFAMDIVLGTVLATTSAQKAEERTKETEALEQEQEVVAIRKFNEHRIKIKLPQKSDIIKEQETKLKNLQSNPRYLEIKELIALNFAHYCQTQKSDVNKILKIEEQKLKGVKFVNLQPWYNEINSSYAEIKVERFFENFDFQNIPAATLNELFNLIYQIDNDFAELFNAHYGIKWHDKNSKKKFEQIYAKSAINFGRIKTRIMEKKSWFKKRFDKLQELIDHDSTLMTKFGSVPDFENDGIRCDMKAKYLINFYWETKTMLEMNKIFLILNLLLVESVEPFHEKIKTTKMDFKKLIAKCNEQAINTNIDECKKQLKTKGFHCLAFRYLYSVLENKKLEIFANEKHGTVELIEWWSGADALKLYFNGKKYYGIEPDLDYRMLIAARNTDFCQEKFLINKDHLDVCHRDYSNATDKKVFASNFLPAYFDTVYEWIDCFLATTNNDSTFLKMLHERFVFEGNILGIAGFQFIISTAILLQSKYDVSVDFILNLTSSVSQDKMVDTLLLARLESQQRKQFKFSSKILEYLGRISNNSLKILLATKLNDKALRDGIINEDIIQKLLIMLFHASSNNTELENMTLEEWKNVAEKHKNFDTKITSNNLESIGYYITNLRQQGRIEADLLEKYFKNSEKFFYIPQKIVGQICTLISYNEINFDKEYYLKMEKLFAKITQDEKLFKHSFITNELQQANMLKSVEYEYSNLISDNVKQLNKISKYIQGVHDTDDAKKKHRIQKTNKIVEILQNPIIKETSLLNKIDSYIFTKFNKNLRDTQKIAIMYAIKSEMNLLSQVNTGEGKSFVVVAIAIMRVKLLNKNVDIITSSPILARRDARVMGEIFEAMGVSVDHNCHELTENRMQAYKANVVYGEIGRFQRDYLLHNFYRKNILGDRLREKTCVIIDEVDNMLLDNGNNMLYLSHSIPGMDLLEPLFVHLHKLVCFPAIKGNQKNAFATENIEASILSDLLGGITKEDIRKMANIYKENEIEAICLSIWNFLIEEKFIDSEGYLIYNKIAEFRKAEASLFKNLKKITTALHAQKIITCYKVALNRIKEISIPRYLIPFVRQHLKGYIENAKRGLFMNHDGAYVVSRDSAGEDITPKIVIIDQNTGVDLTTCQWSEGLHQQIQIKHGCRVSPISMKAVFISNVEYLKGYSIINGLSGTLGSTDESETLKNLYDADLIKIPTFRTKRFYENVPVIALNENEWFDSIFDEVINQISADRSVLIICKSIAEVKEIQKNLFQRYKSSKDAKSYKIIECFSSIIPYERENDNIDFVDKNELKCGMLIIATNLAGRGTDIKLSKDLCNAGGLHVIVSFLPENSRIEDQAYGRAARSGDPGSGQIIALIDESNGFHHSPSVFELKVFRDNAEIHRLKSMTDFYNFHTKIEEECLKKFKEHCLQALGEMNNSRKDDKEIPTKEEIIYFALLDEWAQWLDAQGEAIKQCEKDKDEKQKCNIIASVETFLASHPITPVDKALKWVKCPQPLLTLALVEIFDGSNDKADEVLNRIIEDYPEFSGEAYYYKGIISQQNVRTVKKLPERNNKNLNWFQQMERKFNTTINNQTRDILIKYKDILPDEICEINEKQKMITEDYFLQSIPAFYERAERKDEQNILISRLQKAIMQDIIKSEGYQNQTSDTWGVSNCLIANVHDMIGHPLSSLTLFPNAKTIEEKYAAFKSFTKYESECYITPKVLSNIITDRQCEILRCKYLVPKIKIKQFFESQIKNGQRVVFDENEIKKAFKLPSREEFWSFLDTFGCFVDQQEFYILNTTSSDGEIEELKTLKVIETPESNILRIQLSDYDLASFKLYNAFDVEKAFEKDLSKLKWLNEMNYLIKDASANINLEAYVNTVHFPNYDYFVIEDLAEWLEISVEEAKWITNLLVSKNTVHVKINNFEKINEKIYEIPNYIHEKYHSLIFNFGHKKIDDFNSNVVTAIYGSEQSAEIYEELKQHKVIIPYEKHVYFQNGDQLECPYLPESLRSSVEMFLYNKFAYTFAYNALFKSFEAAINKSNIEKPILLTWKPYNSLFKDLLKYGFIHGHHIDPQNREFIEDIDHKQLKEIESKVKSKLFAKSATLVPTKVYFDEENIDANFDVRSQAINNMRQVGKIGENYYWIFWLLVKVAFTITMGFVTGFTNIVVDIIMNLNSYYATAMTVLAAIGTLLYYTQISKAKYISQNGREPLEERYRQLIDFHSKNNKLHNKLQNKTQLVQTLSTLITTKLNGLFKFEAKKEISIKMKEGRDRSKMGYRKFYRIFLRTLDQSSEWNLFRNAIRDCLISIKPSLIATYFQALEKCKSNSILKINNAISECQATDEKLNIEFSEYDKKLLYNLTTKMVKDCITTMEEIEEKGEDEKAVAIPKEFLDSDQDDNCEEDDDDVMKTEMIDKLETIFQEKLEDVYKFEVFTEITNPLIKIFTKYIDHASDEPQNASKILEFLEKNTTDKYHSEQKQKEFSVYQSMPFIIHDLQTAVEYHFNNSSQNSNLLYVMIRHGHPLHYTMMDILVNVLYKVFNAYMKDLSKLKVAFQGTDIIYVSSEKKFKGKIGTITLTLSNGYFYICQNDSKKMHGNKHDSDYIGSCLYETTTQKNAMLEEMSKMGHEAFRELILKYFNQE